MRAPRLPRQAKVKQHGAALMIMIVIMVVGVAAVLIGALSFSALKSARQERTSTALAQAKEALIGYAITYGDTHTSPPQVHGYLPCPDIDGNGSGNPEGSSELSCDSKNVSSIGRLPWKTLGLPALRDGDGECLWYAVSGTFQNNQKTDLMNWDTPGLLKVLDASGATIASDVVAVIFAPGAVLGSQNRAANGNAPICGGNYTATNYLDSDGTINNAVVSGTANAISQFRAGTTAQVNDQFIIITRDNIFNARNFAAKLDTMTHKVAECIASYGKKNQISGVPSLANKSLPWAAYGSLTNYTDNLIYNDKSGLYAGRVPYKVNNSQGQTGNSISNPYYLLQDDNPIGSAYCPIGWADIYPWWNNWKDHLFYGIAYNFRPINSNTTNCGGCLSINGSGQMYAAVVIFAGKKLSSQSRANKSVVTDYLEGYNKNIIVATPDIAAVANGYDNYQATAASSTFNDIVYYIKQDLSVIKY